MGFEGTDEWSAVVIEGRTGRGVECDGCTQTEDMVLSLLENFTFNQVSEVTTLGGFVGVKLVPFSSFGTVPGAVVH